ncbi:MULTISPECIES: ribosome biogenesis GTPase Der [Fusobacterium]|jgi:GTP-binding protein|uniref:GTPase Der n=2 Tax=Fusobacterium TaxID=848 RepID=A0ABN5JE49_FUSVA|nr:MULTISPECIES: ribosome biogenesis GTPase Der [Fusobacterium]AVQ30175.1 ribosome biogenesis GTPase Der [Fusobacterium varium ATCC 27725]EES64797.1 ribosome biogenesis GTPase Der [Fusobacterium varium ATCC 27725]MCD7979878.1 ribosome biogenesis GTPase Der [Fusobacterium sp.]MCF0170899.1 ribosome biogenesis GTPase Der [Fusobacterium varium]MCF2671932.1 ribosome biogenesis GTPase Der [Fusobacterium varium]
MKPIVAIVGRPNVGKSTLFNNLVGDRIAIVDDMPGVTRDRLYRETEWNGVEFVVVDTGGLEPRNNEFMMTKIKEQAEVAMNEADVILFVVDGKSGVNPLDEEIAYILRKKQKPIILCVNKIDNFLQQQDDVYDFWGLGFEHLIPVSGAHKVNLGDMLDMVTEMIEKIDLPEEEEDVLKLAIIGKPNAGKSSLVNKLSGEERTIVSDIAGTTRDAIDTIVQYKDNKYMIIDTAGIRRKSKVEESLEYYSVLRAIKTIKRADVCILMLDGKEGLTEQDKRIAGIAAEELKPIVVVVNKWDLVDKNKVSMKSMKEELYAELPFLSYAPIEFVSALTGQRTTKILEISDTIYEEYTKRISTGILNTVLKEAVLMNNPPTRKGRVVKINYATQVSTAPPKFVLFCNYPELIHFSYARYIENKFREAFGFDGSPILISFEKKNAEKD